MDRLPQTSSVKISIRLKQKDASGAEVYTPLISPRLVVGSQDIPVVFPRIKGAYGVENGTVEVVDVEKDTVIASYPVFFLPGRITSVLYHSLSAK